MKTSTIREGMKCKYIIKKYFWENEIILARIVNIRRYKNKLEANLLDRKTGQILLDSPEKPAVFFIHEAIQKGIIVIEDDNYEERICSNCGEIILFTQDEICEKCKKKLLKDFFEKRVTLNGKPFTLDDEQLEAVNSKDNSLIIARAGAGKTRVITAKLIDLFTNNGLHEDEVLAFCFNRDAVNEIRKRLNSQCLIDNEAKYQNYDVVRTFHSFAIQLVDVNVGSILSDDRNNNRTILIKKIIDYFRKKDNNVREQIEKYFLSETLLIDRRNFKTMNQYYSFIRNSRYRTLNNENVRSVAEKYIADFLFEHNIEYYYEEPIYLSTINTYKSHLSRNDKEKLKEFQNNQNEMHPDFYLPQYDYVWEHWAVIGKETQKEKETFSKTVGDYYDYLKNKNFKQQFWNNWRENLVIDKHYRIDVKKVKKLIETCGKDFENCNREDIEAKLRDKLEGLGIECKKLPKEEIMKRVWEKSEDYFTEQIKRFIDKYEQTYFEDEEEFKKQVIKIKQQEIINQREIAFWRLGYLIYQKYKKILDSNNNEEEFKNYNEFKMDFSQCLYEAIKKIQKGECDERILKLKWILIDEYQDFSKLFNDLIMAIIQRNPDIKLFCVGDDWQAINRFAGSDLKYFNEYTKRYSSSRIYNITANYRSEKHIVNYANNFMKKQGVQGKMAKGIRNTSFGIIEKKNISNERDEIDSLSKFFEDKGPWFKMSKQSKVRKYMRFILNVINKNPNKKIMILTRTGQFLGKELDEIERILIKESIHKTPDVCIKTVHRSKGEEADIVIITEVDKNHFPIFHPDTRFFRIFGDTMEELVFDEIRLYYVALTRAKSSLYILYEEASDFVLCDDENRRNYGENIRY